MRKAAALVLAAVLLSGCTIASEYFTEPTGRVCVDRQQFIDDYAVLKVLYKMLREDAQARCERGERTCDDLPLVDAQAKAISIRVQAKIEVPESELDKAAIKDLIKALISLAP